ncbi:MAG TPA: hypothetical protein DCQ93_03140 [Bacteroidetes bacterium]|nr:hypothetical protein [Bacteroidota bacterium]
MKKIFLLIPFLFVINMVFADIYPVLRVTMKGGIVSKVNFAASDLSNRTGAASWCFNYVQQTLGSVDFQDMQYNNDVKLDVTDYTQSEELMKYAQQQVSTRRFKGSYLKEVNVEGESATRYYKVSWVAHNRFGDKCEIEVERIIS